MAKTVGQRFYLVRLARGDGVRRAEPIRLFVAHVLEETGTVIHPSELSDIENDKPSKAVTIEHVAAVAAVDPKRRGKLWLGWGEELPEGVRQGVNAPGYRAGTDPDVRVAARPRRTKKGGAGQ